MNQERSPYNPSLSPRASGGLVDPGVPIWRLQQIQVVAPRLRDRETPWDLIRGLVDVGKIPPDAVIREITFFADGTIVRYAVMPPQSHPTSQHSHAPFKEAPPPT